MKFSTLIMAATVSAIASPEICPKYNSKEQAALKQKFPTTKDRTDYIATFQTKMKAHQAKLTTDN